MEPQRRDNHDIFRTTVPVKENGRKIRHGDQLLTIGSCFSDHIASYLADYHFENCNNPTGILFNPASIAATIERLLDDRNYSEDELFNDDGLWKSFHHHSDFDAPSSDLALEAMNREFSRARKALERLDTLILTFGTAYAFQLVDTGHVVANCHRLSHSRFTRSRLTVESVISRYTALFNRLYTLRPGLSIICTVSPVRHLRDTPHENQLSKSTLFVALGELEQRFPGICYFPSYEILMDELRDYRFYAEDMCHPAPCAVASILERFTQSTMSPEAIAFIHRFTPVLKARRHAIKQTATPAVRRFAASMLSTIDDIEGEFPDIPLREEREYFASLLSERHIEQHHGRKPEHGPNR